VLRGEAGEAVLDTYQTERESHVRAVTETAIAMGRVVCMPDPEMAAQRDAMMLAQRAAGEQPVPPADPKMGPGAFVVGAARAASIFPQDEAGGLRLDDVMGRGAWLIARRGADVAGVSSKLVSRVNAIDGDRLKPFAARLGAYLDGAGADAVIVRADRYVFGTGSVQGLMAEWERALAGQVGR
jgi:3-(3-hydroxy-phenyl)propionate hydroxylase